MINKITVLTTALLLISSSNAFSMTKSIANQAIEKAITANTAAQQVGYEWRDTRKLIKAAKKLMESQDFTAAVIKANNAEKQAIAALAQYHTETKRFELNHK